MKFGLLRSVVVEPEPEPEPNRFVCGVPGCLDGRVVSDDGRYTTVECDTHEARTHHLTVKSKVGEQQIIRVQDGWRQHGTSKPPGK